MSTWNERILAELTQGPRTFEELERALFPEGVVPEAEGDDFASAIRMLRVADTIKDIFGGKLGLNTLGGYHGYWSDTAAQAGWVPINIYRTADGREVRVVEVKQPPSSFPDAVDLGEVVAWVRTESLGTKTARWRVLGESPRPPK